MVRAIGTVTVAAVLLLMLNAAYAVERQGETVGEIVTAKGDESVRFVGSQPYQPLTVGQRLAPGDIVKTGPYGGVSILFRDDTKVRVHRNSTLEISAVRGTGNAQVSRLKLLTGSAWSRAKSLFRTVSATLPGGRPTVLEMQTPTATIGIRGTDWHVSVKESGETLVTVVTGEVSLFNEFGNIAVGGGEQGMALPGQAPSKRVIVDMKDRPLMALEFDPHWFELLQLSSADTTQQLIAGEQKSAAIPAASRTAADWMTLARAQFDRGRLSDAEQSVAATRSAGGAPDLDLIDGMLRARRGETSAARPLLERAKSALTGRDQILAELGLAGLDFDAGEFAKADAALTAIMQRHPDSAEAYVYRPALSFFAGDQDAALERANDGERRFPKDARFPAIVGVFHLVRGEDDAMKRAIERSLALDPAQPLALSAEGVYYHEIEPNADRSLAAYEAALKVSNSSDLWNNYALLQDDLGRDDAAEAAYQQAMESDPNSALAMTNYAMWLVSVDRFAEARTLLKRAETIKPGYSTARMVEGFITLAEGNPEQAVDELDKAIVANPSEPQVYSVLSYAQYHAERFEDASDSIEQARLADPDDPVPLVVGAVMAQDQAEAGKAIRYAREGLDKIRKIGSFAVEDIVNTRSGVSNVGSAYTNLDLDDWGEYYAQSAFSPYDASSHIFLSTLYPSVRAQKGEAGQGLLLDSLAIAASNRYFDFVRLPRTYLTIGGSIGSEDNAHTDNAAGTIQGFARLPVPVAYNVSAARSTNDGFRTNSHELSETVLMSVGTAFNDHKDQVLGIVAALHNQGGLPGDAASPDPDDESENQGYIGSLAWQHRFDYDNRLMARVAVGSLLSRETNANPFGPGQNPLLYSLIRQFGLSDTQTLVDNGLFDATGFFAAPTAVTNSAATQAVCVVFPDICAVPLSLPTHVDTNPVGVAEIEQHEFDLQFRHLLNVGKQVEFTYGAEWTPQEQEIRATRSFSPVATDIATLIDNRTPPTQFIDFFLLEPRAISIKDKSPITGAQAYTQARWQDSDKYPRWWVEGGAFVRYFDDDTRDQISVDPRLGVAWEPMQGHWLRAAYQREMGIITPLNGTLAPVAVAGLAASDKLLLLNKQVLDDVQARWDAEWLPGLFSVVAFEHQEIDADPLNGEFDQRADELSFGVNAWFLERFGAFARYRHTWSENTEDGSANEGNDLALLAEHEFDVGLSWAHPKQIRAGIVGAFVGERWGNAANTEELDGFFTVNAIVNWQPMQRHWSFTLAAANLFDEDYDTASGEPAPGTAVSLTAEYRF